MSRKTKKEKLLAELRRKIEMLEKSDVSVESNAGKNIIKEAKSERLDNPSYTYIHAKRSTDSVNRVFSVSGPVTDYSYVFHDLRKILLLTLIAVGIQLILYIILNGGIPPLLKLHF